MLPRAQRRPCPDALRKQECLDQVLDAQLLLNEAFALAVRSLGILLLGCRHADHAAHLLTPAQPGREHAQNALSVEAVGLGPDVRGASPGYWSARARRQICR